MNNFIVRTITGSIFVAVITLMTILSGVSFLILINVINFLCLFEFYSLLLPDKKPFEKYLGIATGSFILMMLVLIITEQLSIQWIYHVIPVFAFMFIVKLFENTQREFETLAFQLLGIIYITFPLAMLAGLGYLNSFYYSYTIPMSFFILHWCSDTSAYLVGKNFGKTRLFERISPKKSVEGFVGALIITTGIAYLIGMFWDDFSKTDWIVIAVLIVCFGTLGDLIESLLKRNLLIKDSGNILPGHGGILDRFDGFFMSIPAVYFYLLITR